MKRNIENSYGPREGKRGREIGLDRAGKFCGPLEAHLTPRLYIPIRQIIHKL